MTALSAALRKAAQLVDAPLPESKKPARSRARVFAIGDLQAPFERLARVLAHHGLLGMDGMIARDARLISIGDHFDYGVDDPDASALQGITLLRYLAEHDADQVVILCGNHDISRVQELIAADDETFGAARERARAIRALAEGPERTRREASFRARFPALPAASIVARDYASFVEQQRTMVQRLLLSRRMRLAYVAALPNGQPVLFTHAAVTSSQLSLLGARDGADAHEVADMLNRFLDEAVDRVRDDWQKGKRTQLDLSPLHVPGDAHREGGGLLYQRPSRHVPPPPGPGVPARRFDPRALPTHLVQACGHTRHPKCVEDLGDWVAPGAELAKRGALRTLHSDGEHVSYDARFLEPKSGHATLYFLDGELSRAEPHDYELLTLADLQHKPSQARV